MLVTLRGMSNEYERQLKELIAIAESQGWQVDRTANNHPRFTPSDPAAQIVIAAGTSTGGERAVQNLRSQLRRSGLVI